MHSPQGNISTVQIFHDGLNDALRDCAAKFESAGYRVQFAPASGPPAVWFGHYEVVGQRDHGFCGACGENRAGADRGACTLSSS